jgi:hypothetical protein
MDIVKVSVLLLLFARCCPCKGTAAARRRLGFGLISRRGPPDKLAPPITAVVKQMGRLLAPFVNLPFLGIYQHSRFSTLNTGILLH